MLRRASFPAKHLIFTRRTEKYQTIIPNRDNIYFPLVGAVDFVF